MAKIAARDVFVHGGQHGGENRWFHPGDEVPTWAEALITNETVFANPEEGVILQAEREEIYLDEIKFNPVDYSQFKVAELKEMLAERDLDTQGHKSTLIQRLEDNDASLG